MYPLTPTIHSLMRYSTRTGRNENLANNLIESIKKASKIEVNEIREVGFNFKKILKDDDYYLWYDENIGEYVLAIVTKKGFVKTVLTQNIFSQVKPGKQVRLEYRQRIFGY